MIAGVVAGVAAGCDDGPSPIAFVAKAVHLQNGKFFMSVSALHPFSFLCVFKQINRVSLVYLGMLTCRSSLAGCSRGGLTQ